MMLEASPDEFRTLFGWIADAWRHALPKLNLNSSFETQCRWCTIDKDIKLCRKIGVICMIYEHDRNIMSFRIELTPAIRYVIIKGAPEHLWLMLTAALSGQQFAIQIVE